MTTYKILDRDINISTAEENYRAIHNLIAPYYDSSRYMFREWYSNQTDCKSVYANRWDIIEKIKAPIITSGIKLFLQLKIYTIDAALFNKKYLGDCSVELLNRMATMMAQISEIEGDQKTAAEYRQLRKESRGRVIGGGFGLNGAARGMVTAGVMNAASGLAHSVVNAVGNLGSSISAGADKIQLYYDYKDYLSNCIEDMVLRISDALILALQTEANIEFVFPTQENFDKAKAIFNNAGFPTESKKDLFLDALQLNPYDRETYEEIWQHLGDPSGDLLKMARDYKIDLQQHIDYVIGEQQEFLKRNSSYNFDAKNPVGEAIRNEQDIRNSIRYIEDFCDQRALDYNTFSLYKKLQSALSLVEKSQRTVEDFEYSTSEEADEVRADIQQFEETLYDLDIFENGVWEKLDSQNFKSVAFKVSLRSRFEKELALRNPLLLSENIMNLINATGINVLQNAFEVRGVHDGIEEKSGIFVPICEFEKNEIPLLLIDRSHGLIDSKGKGKSGIILTNLYFRSYRKTLLSAEKHLYDIDKIEKIEALGDDIYRMSNSDESSFKFSAPLKYKNEILTTKGQNNFAKLLFDIVKLVRNINVKQRKQLGRIFVDSKLCVCGTYVLASEKQCPTCKRYLQSDGTFAEGTVCPNCSMLVKASAKFCLRCGYDFVKKEMPTKDIKTSCPNCGNEIKSGKKFCNQCGMKIN